MRAALAGVAVAALIFDAALAASKLTPKEIQTEFFDGKAFTAATTSGTKFKMTFSGDGKVTREPQDKAGAKGEGTWKLSKDGFCTTWKGSAANVAAAQNALLHRSRMNSLASLGRYSAEEEKQVKAA